MDNISMVDVIHDLGLPVKLKKTSGDMDCPVCGGKKTLHFDLNREVFNCPKCGSIGGGVLDAWAFFRNIEGINKKEKRKNAKKDLDKFYNTEEVVEGWQDLRKEREFVLPPAKEYELAPIEPRDYTYKNLLDMLELTNAHRKSLHKRGLTDEDIEAYGFKSFPKANLAGIASSLLFKGCNLKGVPGFYQDDQDNWTLVSYGNGILIPVKNAKGQILAFQIRLDSGKPKYLTLSSSGRQSGASAKTFVHFAAKNCSDVSTIKKVILTEGPLKGDIINKYLNVPVLAIPGVNAINHLEAIIPQLKERGLKTVEIAFDMDFYDNEYVKKALIKMKRLLSDFGLEYVQLTWNKEQKGLDDFLLDMKKETQQ